MANSGPVASGDQALAAHYNDLRADVLDPDTGHRHDGTDGVNLGELRLQVFGDGTDGDVTIAADTGLNRDMWYRNLTVNAGATLITNGYRIFVKEVLTLNGRIAWNMDEHVGWALLTQAITSVYTGNVTVNRVTDLPTGRQGFPTTGHGYVRIDNEIIFCNALGTTIGANMRAMKGTLAAAHAIGAKVLFLPHGSDPSVLNFGTATGVLVPPASNSTPTIAAPYPGGLAGASGVGAAGGPGNAASDASASLLPMLRAYASLTAGLGGVGGTGPAGTPAGGTAGIAGKSASAAIMGAAAWGRTGNLPIHDVWAMLFGTVTAAFHGTSDISIYAAPFGGGGGGGGGGGAPAGGSGGRGGFGGTQGIGGQVVLVATRDLVGAGSIEAKGQNGGDGNDGAPGTGTNAGGGAGGGGGVGGPGGVLYLITANRAAWTGTTSVLRGTGGLGGAGGAPSGTGVAGNAGANGPDGMTGLLVEVRA
ncbi:MAG: hypothetical protein WEG56_13255 [Chloroflexota bacterium]